MDRTFSHRRSLPRVFLMLGITAAVVGSWSPATAQASDWPRWLGPNGDNVAPEPTGFDPDLSKWKVAWKANVGLGYSAVAVSGNRAITLGHDQKAEESVSCLDASTGETVWKVAYEAQLLPRMHPGGPNATATVVGDRVIALSKDGQVLCLSLAKGETIWKVNLAEILGIKLPAWGFASSPVVVEGRVFLGAGKFAALDLATGKPLWVSKEAYQPGHATPVVFRRDRAEFVAGLDGKGISILKGGDGVEVARHPFKAMFDMTASTPVIFDSGRRILMAGNTTAEMLEFDGGALRSRWVSKDLRNAMNNCVVSGNLLFGIDGRHETAADRFVCVNADDGSLVWAKENFGYGTLIGVGRGAMLALTEPGELVTIKVSREGYSELGRRQVLSKTCWTTPVVANDRIYVRNDRGEVVCLAR